MSSCEKRPFDYRNKYVGDYAVIYTYCDVPFQDSCSNNPEEIKIIGRLTTRSEFYYKDIEKDEFLLEYRKINSGTGNMSTTAFVIFSVDKEGAIQQDCRTGSFTDQSSFLLEGWTCESPLSIPQRYLTIEGSRIN